MRRLSAREESVLRFMIEHGDGFDQEVTTADRRRWAVHVDDIRAGRRCACGSCPSIELSTSSGRPSEAATSRRVLHASAPDADVLLFVDDDVPSYLELAPHDDDPVRVFPPVEALRAD